MRRYDRLKHILQLDPEEDFLEISRLMTAYEFPWDWARALELALYRTYAVPSVGQLLSETAELTGRSQKRYDDTALLLDTVLEHGFDSVSGRTAIRRINRMHRSYSIPDGDMRYVLCTFVVTPKRWLDRYGWRTLTRHEQHALAVYYRTLGRHMGIPGVPSDYEEFETFLDDYEAEHFGWNPGARKVADATLELMASWYPEPVRPAVRGAAKALLDDSLIEAFRFTPPQPGVRRLAGTALRTRARAVRLMPPRNRPRYARQNPQIKSYPNGYQIAELGTFPGRGSPGVPACPVVRGEK